MNGYIKFFYINIINALNTFDISNLKFVILFIVLFTLFIFFIVIKITNRFWSSQPVFHVYNIWNWLFPKGIIQHTIPKNGKFYDLNIVCTTFKEATTLQKKQFLYFLQSNCFLKNNSLSLLPKKNEIYEYLKYQKNYSFLSLQYNGYDKKLVGILSSRLLSGHLNGNKIFISYMDNLCIHKDYLKSDFGYKQIYSHYLKSRSLGAPPIFLFKRYKRLKSLVPFVSFNSYLLNINKLIKPNLNLPNTIICYLITSQNFNILLDYMFLLQKSFKNFIIPPFNVLKNLVESNNIFPFVIKNNTQLIGIIFYKKTYLYYKKQEIIEYIASYCSKDMYKYFVNSFTNTLYILKKKIDIRLISVDNISHNNLILNNLLKTTIPLNIIPTLYYFYNFIYKPVKIRETFILI